MTIPEIVKTTNARWIQKSKKHTSITDLSIDSRRVVNAGKTLFFAIPGEQRSGIQFVKDAYIKGVRNFVLGDNIPFQFKESVNILVVKNPVLALQQISKAVREKYRYPVIAITGSNGKTIVKEWLSNILSGASPYNEKAGIVKSPKSFNSQIGVPLSVWGMQQDNTIGIFEAGISKVGEMEFLEYILRPDIGIFTNIGDAHNEFFTNKAEKLHEKFRLFHHTKHLVINTDDVHIQPALKALKKINPDLHVFRWSKEDPGAEVYIESEHISRQSCRLRYRYRGKSYHISIPFSQEAYIQNTMSVLCTLLLLKIDFNTIKSSIAQLKAVAMRLELRDAINDCYVIADTYNSDLSSLKVALEFLSQQIGKKKTIILSDQQESGTDYKKLMQEVNSLLEQYKITKLIGIGPNMMSYKQVFGQSKEIERIFFDSTDAFLEQYHPSQFEKEYILLKGARKFAFEKIQTRLELKIHHTVLEVDLEALAHNLKVYKRSITPSTKLMAMVKAHSYGSGSLEIAKRLQYEHVDYLAVAYADEGIELRNGGISLPIMVMSPEIHSFDSMVRWQLEPEIFNIHSLQLFIETAQSQQEINYPVHIKLDTGMHRLGFNEGDLDELLYIIHHTETLKVASIFSHLAGSDDSRFDAYTLKQSRLFEKMADKIIKGLNYTPLLHLVNSAGIVNHPELKYDMVRLGIGLYGIDSSAHIQKKLRNVSTLKTYVVQIRGVKKSETVGYSRRGKLKRDSRIATVAIGYADGYFRDFGNSTGYMLIGGHKAPIIGSICMDMCMLDVTDIPHVQEGDEVIVFGEALSPIQLAEWARTIPYEILTGLSPRVKRIYVNE